MKSNLAVDLSRDKEESEIVEFEKVNDMTQEELIGELVHQLNIFLKIPAQDIINYIRGIEVLCENIPVFPDRFFELTEFLENFRYIVQLPRKDPRFRAALEIFIVLSSKSDEFLEQYFKIDPTLFLFNESLRLQDSALFNCAYRFFKNCIMNPNALKEILNKKILDEYPALFIEMLQGVNEYIPDTAYNYRVELAFDLFNAIINILPKENIDIELTIKVIYHVIDCPINQLLADRLATLEYIVYQKFGIKTIIENQAIWDFMIHSLGDSRFNGSYKKILEMMNVALEEQIIDLDSLPLLEFLRVIRVDLDRDADYIPIVLQFVNAMINPDNIMKIIYNLDLKNFVKQIRVASATIKQLATPILWDIYIQLAFSEPLAFFDFHSCEDLLVETLDFDQSVIYGLFKDKILPFLSKLVQMDTETKDPFESFVHDIKEKIDEIQENENPEIEELPALFDAANEIISELL